MDSSSGNEAATELDTARAREAVEVLADAFEDGPNFTYTFPRADQRSRALHHLFTAAVGDVLRSGVALAVESAGRLTGVALWHPPGGFPVTPRREARMLPALVRVGLAAPNSIGRLAQLNRAVLDAAPNRSFWYLQAIAVLPSEQGRGFGGALLRGGLARADADGSGAYLETFAERSASWYASFGFIPIKAGVPPFDGAPPFWTMLREPR